jgi:hypothetical protein
MIGDREADITETYGDTFSWMLEDDESNLLARMSFTETKDSSKSKVNSSFVSWLESDSKHLFWLSGKAASGKSTLMKYLYNDKRTKKKLKKWAGGSEPILAAFFFFERGDVLQKSREGLLRSLLYQILSQRRDLIPLVFDSNQEDREHPIPLPQMTWPALKKAFAQILEKIPDSTKICLFVDGLDEYRMMDREKDYGEDEMHLLSFGTNDDFKAYPEGNWIRDGHQEIASIFQNIKKSNVKICVASRELAPFEAAFATTPRLRIHEFTKADIHNYVYSRLMGEGREHFYDADEMKEIADTVVKHAEGVFLWVRLVVEELRKGQDDGDRIEDLRAKLMKLPKTLGGRDGLYMRMVDMSPSRDEAIKLFQLVLYHRTPPDLDVLFDAADDLYESDNSIMDFFNDQKSLGRSAEIQNDRPLRAVKQEVKFFTIEQTKRNLDQLERRLKSRCMGLLEITRTSTKVIFMHATAKEFISQHLEKTEPWNDIEGRSRFSLQFLSAYVLKMKRTHMAMDSQGALGQAQGSTFESCFNQLIGCAKILDNKGSNDPRDDTQDHADDAYFQILDECRRIYETPSLSQDQNLINRCFKEYVEANVLKRGLRHGDFLSISVDFGLEKYIRMSLMRTGIDPNNSVKVMYEFVLSYGMENFAMAGQIIGRLLSHALNLPGVFRQSTFAMSVWETLLHCAVCLKKAGHQIDDVAILLGAMALFKGRVHARNQALFLTYDPKPLGPRIAPFWQGSTQQVLSGLLKLPESVVVPLIGVQKVDGSNTYFPELPEPGLWKVRFKARIEYGDILNDLD